MKKIAITKQQCAIVDDNNYEYLNQWKWHYAHGYAVRTVKTTNGKRTIYMHRIVNETPEGLFTDHINRNRLDNRRANLRTATHKLNVRNRSKLKSNTSGYIGVTWLEANQTYVARICDNYTNCHLGCSSDPKFCALLYDLEALKLWGESAETNFSKKQIDKMTIEYADKLQNRRVKTSQYPGVSFDRERNKWCAYHQYKRIGRYQTESEAFEALQNHIKLRFPQSL